MRDILTIEIPASGAYALWITGSPLLGWLFSTIV